MINPQIVQDKHSPYSSSVRNGRPVFEPPKRARRRYGRYIAALLFTTLIAGATYSYAEYRHLQNTVLVDHEGDGSAILRMGVSNTDNIDPSYFKQFGDGRITLVLAGMGGANHPGGNLTDSLQVISIDTINKKMTTTSIPRDLYVSANGSRSKINAVYYYAEQKKKGSGPAALREAVSNVLGVPVSYFALVDFSGIKDIVDALGGIDVDVPKAIYDPLFPAADQIRYEPFTIKAGMQHMDGATALKYARSRETTSDFDRSARQQLIMAAMKKKALSAGVLTNPVKVVNLINALGSHFKTDASQDIRALLDVYRSIPNESSSTFVLDTSSKLGLLTATTDPVAGYISYPVTGIGKYEQVRQWFASNNPDPVMAKESPSVTLINSGKVTEKQMEAVAQKLKDYGYSVTVSPTSATGTKYTTTRLFTKDLNGKPVSRTYLGNLLSVNAEKGSIQDSSTDFELVVMSNTATTSPQVIQKSPAATQIP